METDFHKICFWLLHFFLAFLLASQQVMAGGTPQAAVENTEQPLSTIWEHTGDEPLGPETLLPLLADHAKNILLNSPSSLEDLNDRVKKLEDLGFRMLSYYYTVSTKEIWMPKGDWNAIAFLWNRVSRFSSSKKNTTDFESILTVKGNRKSKRYILQSIRDSQRLSAIACSAWHFLKSENPIQNRAASGIGKLKIQPQEILAPDVASTFNDPSFKENGVTDLWYQILLIIWLDASTFNYHKEHAENTALVDWRDYASSKTDQDKLLVVSLDTEAISLPEEAHTRISALQTSIVTMNKKIEKLSAANVALFEQDEGQSNQIEEMSSTLLKLKEQYDDFKAKHNDLTEKHNKLEAENNELKERLLRNSKEHQQLKEQFVQTREVHEKEQQTFKALVEDLTKQRVQQPNIPGDIANRATSESPGHNTEIGGSAHRNSTPRQRISNTQMASIPTAMKRSQQWQQNQAIGSHNPPAVAHMPYVSSTHNLVPQPNILPLDPYGAWSRATHLSQPHTGLPPSIFVHTSDGRSMMVPLHLLSQLRKES